MEFLQQLEAQRRGYARQLQQELLAAAPTRGRDVRHVESAYGRPMNGAPFAPPISSSAPNGYAPMPQVLDKWTPRPVLSGSQGLPSTTSSAPASTTSQYYFSSTAAPIMRSPVGLSAPPPQRTEIDLTDYQNYYRSMQQRGASNSFANPLGLHRVPPSSPPKAIATGRLPSLSGYTTSRYRDNSAASSNTNDGGTVSGPKPPPEIIEIDDD